MWSCGVAVRKYPVNTKMQPLRAKRRCCRGNDCGSVACATGNGAEAHRHVSISLRPLGRRQEWVHLTRTTGNLMSTHPRRSGALCCRRVESQPAPLAVPTSHPVHDGSTATQPLPAPGDPCGLRADHARHGELRRRECADSDIEPDLVAYVFGRSRRIVQLRGGIPLLQAVRRGANRGLHRRNTRSTRNSPWRQSPGSWCSALRPGGWPVAGTDHQRSGSPSVPRWGRSPWFSYGWPRRDAVSRAWPRPGGG